MRIQRLLLCFFAGLLWIAGISGLAEGSAIQQQPPDVTFQAVCSTCHGVQGFGGISWVNGDDAPDIAGRSPSTVKSRVREGTRHISMPGFGPQEITDAELDALATFIKNNPKGIPPPPRPVGTEIRVDILDADPWYYDHADDNALDPFDDTRRITLGSNQYLTVTNTGRAWHTLTNAGLGKDSGFIGLDGAYFADQTTGLAAGCNRYHCKIHPYMQFEVCTAGNTPAQLTRANKNPIGLPATPGRSGDEIWVDAQSQDESPADPFDGAIQVIDPATWNIKAYIPDVGNNPHNPWPGKDRDGRSIVVTTSWHGSTVEVIDAFTKTILGSGPVGAAPAHVMVTPGPDERWFVSIMGGLAFQEIDPSNVLVGRSPAIRGPILGDFSGHGLWFCDDGDHFIASHTLANTVSLWSASRKRFLASVDSGGEGPLATGILNGFGAGGCVRGYAYNSGINTSPSTAVLDIDPVAETITRNTTAVPPALRDANGNLKHRDTSVSPVRWAHLPIQGPVSPADATTHGRFIVAAEKASFNVLVTQLDSVGNPVAVYTFPSGLGAHGVSYGRKGLCDTGNPLDICYYAYVANTFDDYASVFDLERIVSSGPPGSATETVHLEGFGAQALCGAPTCNVSITVFCPDCRSGAHVGDVPLQLTTTGRFSYLKEPVWINPLNTALVLDLDLITNTGGQGIVVVPAAPPWP